jgi:hypothetical protein
MRWAEHVRRTWEMNAFKLRLESLEGRQQPLGRPTRRWKDNIKNGPYGNWVWWYGLDSPTSGGGPVADFCEHGNEPSGCVKCEVILD